MANKSTKSAHKKPTPEAPDSSEVETATTPATPDAFQLFEPSANLILKNFNEFVWLIGVPFVLTILSVLQRLTYHPARGHLFDSSRPGLILSLLTIIVGLLVSPGIIVLELALIRGKSMHAGEAFRKGLHYFWKLLGLAIVLTIALSFALLLLIVPFIILLPRVILAPYYLIDQDMSIFGALRASNDFYKKYHGVWGIIGVSILVYLPSIIPLIGSVISTCLNFLYQPAFVFRYVHYTRLEAGESPITPFEEAYRADR